eukprot:scaffold131289_cov21-Tisochrysis_lutea.AAC.2
MLVLWSALCARSLSGHALSLPAHLPVLSLPTHAPVLSIPDHATFFRHALRKELLQLMHYRLDEDGEEMSEGDGSEDEEGAEDAEADGAAGVNEEEEEDSEEEDGDEGVRGNFCLGRMSLKIMIPEQMEQPHGAVRKWRAGT